MSARRWPQLPPVRPSLRPSVRSTSSPPPPQPGRPGPAQRRPEQPRPREETGAAPARPGPAPPPPSSPSVRSSVRPRFRPSVQPLVLRPVSPLARFVSPRLAVSLSLPSRSPAAPPSLLISGPLLRALFSPQSRPFWATRFFGTPPQSAPRSFGAPLENTFHSPQGFPVSFLHILWGFSCTQIAGVSPPLSPHSPWAFPLLGIPHIHWELLGPLGSFSLGPPPNMSSAP